MITHYDNYYGSTGVDIRARQPSKGGPITLIAGSNPGDIAFAIAGGCINTQNHQGTYQYAAALGDPDFDITWTIDYTPGDTTQNIGIVVATTSAFSPYIEVRWNANTQTLTLDNNGGTTTHTTTFATQGTHTFELTQRTFPGGSTQIDLNVDGVNVLGASPSANPATPKLFLRQTGPTGGGTETVLTSLIAKDFATAPTRPTSFQSPQLGVFAQFTPATLSSLAALKYEYPARAIILKGPFAESAVTWLMENTPPENITAP